MTSAGPFSEAAAARRIVRRCNEALNARAVDGMMPRMTPGCGLENTDLPPGGARYQGQAQVCVFWEGSFRAPREPPSRSKRYLPAERSKAGQAATIDEEERDVQ